MQTLVDYFYLVIIFLGSVHFAALMGLTLWRRAQTRNLAAYLRNLVRNFSVHTDSGVGGLHERIDGFIADIREVSHDRQRPEDRRRLYERLMIKDEWKQDLQGTNLETWYHFARTGIEAYPLLGILGTVMAIGLGLATPDPTAATSDAVAASTGTIIQNFANSIWATCAGIAFAVILMMVNALIEPGFDRLIRHRQQVRDVIGAAKVSLGLDLVGPDGGPVVHDEGPSGNGDYAAQPAAAPPMTPSAAVARVQSAAQRQAPAAPQRPAPRGPTGAGPTSQRPMA